MLDMMRDLLYMELAAAKPCWTGSGPLWSLVVMKLCGNQPACLTSYFAQAGFAKAEDILFLVKESREEVIEAATSVEPTYSNADWRLAMKEGEMDVHKTLITRSPRLHV